MYVCIYINTSSWSKSAITRTCITTASKRQGSRVSNAVARNERHLRASFNPTLPETLGAALAIAYGTAFPDYDGRNPGPYDPADRCNNTKLHDRVEAGVGLEPTWPLHDIAITNIVWCMA